MGILACFLYIYTLATKGWPSNSNIIGKFLVSLLLLISTTLSASDLYFYLEFKLKNPTSETISIKSAENITLQPKSIFTTRYHSRPRNLLISSKAGEQYLLINDYWTERLNQGTYLSNYVQIKFIKTHRFKIITDIQSFI